jgi:hypothetical protein
MSDAGQTGSRAITLSVEEFRGSLEDDAPFAARITNLYGAKHIVRDVRETDSRRDLSSPLSPRGGTGSDDISPR